MDNAFRKEKQQKLSHFPPLRSATIKVLFEKKYSHVRRQELHVLYAIYEMGGDKLYSWETDTIKFTHVAPEIEKNKNKSVFFIGINLHVKYVFFIHLFA